MLIHKDPLFSIYFGDNREQIIPADFRFSSDQILQQKQFFNVQKIMHIKDAVFLHQTHSNQGVSLQTRQQIATFTNFSQDGDFLLTNLSGVGIGIVTADCLPIILCDTFNQVIGIVHAGWRGSVNGIAAHAVDQMYEVFGTDPKNLKVFFGPCIKICCYSVGDELLNAVNTFECEVDVVHTSGSTVYFDLPLFNKIQLLEKGIKKDAFHLNYNSCTLCNQSFCSYRRQQQTLYRQMTVVALTLPIF